ncbi:MAG: efflux RND transporter periplasmic adaptor subunit [Acidobacteria bacterium]|nr:efflux RND transporter periplasmic adaptor subunit [Acidobacteriota bacterium]
MKEANTMSIHGSDTLPARSDTAESVDTQPSAESPSARAALNRRAALRAKRRRRRGLWALLLLVIAGGGTWYGYFASAEMGVTYRFVGVDRGRIDRVVASTGMLDAVTTVRVGTQVSGIISEIYVDFNDEVTAGQVVAKIDPKLLEAAVLEAETSLARNLAQLSHAQSEHSKSERLWQGGLTSQVELETAQYSLEVAEQTVASSEIAVDRARQNLSYATIYAPISGTVIERNVDLGQTVAASLSAPQLFMIAADLSSMQILVSVDESDIGLVEPGQAARFEVQAYRDATFDGIVRQVRLQSTTADSVVTYTVVVDVDNRDRRLLPGMTATVDFIVESAADVLRVPNAALRFLPVGPSATAGAAAGRGGAGDERSGGGERGARGAGGQGPRGGAERVPGASRDQATIRGAGQGAATRVWYLDDSGDLVPLRVATGISDGQWTEVRGRDLEAGMQLVAGMTQESQSVVNPFQSSTSNPPQRGFR